MRTDKESLPALYTVREVAALLRLDESTVYKMAADGRIHAWQLGGPGDSVRVPRSEVERLVAGASQPSVDGAASIAGRPRDGLEDGAA